MLFHSHTCNNVGSYHRQDGQLKNTDVHLTRQAFYNQEMRGSKK